MSQSVELFQISFTIGRHYKDLAASAWGREPGLCENHVFSQHSEGLVVAPRPPNLRIPSRAATQGG